MSNLSTVFTTAIANTASYPGQSFFGSNNIKVFLASGTFVVPPNVNQIRVRVHGAGGSGAVATSSDKNRCATGGGGGGLAIKTLNVTPGTSYAVTVGAGGAPAQTLASGNAGGTSSFGAVCSATGGSGGNYATGNAANSAAGATGGTGSGGDLNYTGGGSGTATTTAYSGTYVTLAGTGGGSAASIFGNGYASGNATTGAGTSGNGCGAATGGAGVGGSSGNMTYAGGSAFVISSGGGTLSAGVNVVSGQGTGVGGGGFNFPVSPNAVSNYSLLGGAPTIPILPVELYYALVGNNTTAGSSYGSYPLNAVNRFPGDILMSAAGTGNQQYNNSLGIAPPGCGSSTASGTGANTSSMVFGGGHATTDPNNNGARGAPCFIAGGGGACASYTGTDANAYSGAGGSGMVIVEW